MTHYMSRLVSPSNQDWISFIAGGQGGDIDIDNDGVMPDTRILIDLSQALSQRLGRQMSMYSTYKVDYISISIVNQDDNIDNESGAEFSGKIHWYTPTKHRIDALQLMRQVEKHAESGELDADSFLLSTEKDYTGVRFNWDGDNQVIYPTSEAFTVLDGDQWDMDELFDIYNVMEGEPTQNNALWTGRTGYTDQVSWNCFYRNSSWKDDPIDNDQIYHPESNLFQISNLDAEVLGGLLVIAVDNSSTNDPTAVIDDDYQVHVTIGVTGWSDF